MLVQLVFGFLVAVAIFVPLERVFALRRDQKVLHRGWRSDVVHFVVTNPLKKGLVIVALAVPFVILRATAGSVTGPLVTAQPWWLEMLEAIVLADLFAYWGHRLAHTVPFLWRFHRVHHSIEDMDWLAASRVHPLDGVFTSFVAVLPLVALGFSAASFGAYLVVIPLQALLIHANVRWRFGPLEWVTGTPRWHHWHHAAEPAACNKNFAALLPAVDVVFGTAFMPKDRWPVAYGLGAGAAPVPGGWWRQMLHPFRPAQHVLDAPPALSSNAGTIEEPPLVPA